MLISYRWLARHVDLSGITPEQLVDDLTLSTAEVEGLERFAPHLANVVVGFVEERTKHPDADKLNICTVDVGAEEKLQIVCGAPNIDKGQKVAVAVVGTVLPGDFKIKKSKIRGVESRGMICSVRELELGEDHDGIWVLPEDVTIGTPVSKALDMDDWIIDIDNKSLTHRPDLWGHRGMAREVAAIYKRELKALDTSLPEHGTGTSVPVRIDDPACSRYIGIAIDGVSNQSSPRWLSNLLLAVGQRPLDLLVDVSNFVMLDLGQPNHLFDRKQLGTDGIVVRMAKDGEKMTTLDGAECKLTGQDLLICSGDAPVALAGIMGGENSKVEDGTDQLLLELASFHPTTIRRTAGRVGIRTDSSARFEKSLAPTLPLQAAGHLVRTLASVCPQLSLPAPPTDVGDWQDPSLNVQVRGDRVRLLLGADISDESIADILTRLGFGVTAGAGAMTVSVPARRATKDVTMEQDLVEEVGRIHRYGNIPEQNLIAEVMPAPSYPRRELVRQIQDRLAGGSRFRELIGYSFLANELVERLGLEDEPCVEIVNPIVEGEQRVRRNVTPTLLGLIEKNRRSHDQVRIFEVGKGYRPDEANEAGEPREIHQLSIVWAAPPAGKKDRFDAGVASQLHAVVEDLFHSLTLPAPEWARSEGDDLRSWGHPGRTRVGSMKTNGGDMAAAVVLADLEPGLLRTLGLTGELASQVAVAEISVDVLLDCEKAPPGYQPIPRFPGIKVDVALAMPEAVTAAQMRAAIDTAGKGLVADAELFDVYAGESLGAGKKSLAWHVLLQSPKKTLSDKEAHKFLDRLERGAEGLGGELRRE